MKPLTRPAVLLRYLRFLAWEFRRPLVILILLITLGGLFFHLGLGISYARACHAVFLLVFMENALEFPEAWQLQILFFVIPIIGLGTLAESLVRLGYLIFTEKQHLPEWQRMMASLYRNHIIVVGAGKLGLRVIRGLVQLQEMVVAVERSRESPFLDEIQDHRIPIIQGDGRQQKVLAQAGAAHAKAIVLATDDDLSNLDAALTAQDLNPRIRTVLRLFDDTLATKFAGAFGMPTISTSQVSAPAFIAAATGKKVYHDFVLGGQHLHMTDLTIQAGSTLAGRTIGDVQDRQAINIVMLKGASGTTINPRHETILVPGDTLLALAPIEKLQAIEGENRPRPASN